MISLKNKSSTSIESDEVRSDTDETNNTSQSPISIALFYGKFDTILYFYIHNITFVFRKKTSS